MALHRQIQVSFWQDPFIFELTPEEKYFYIYLMTNSKTTQCGIYEISKKVISVETGYNLETIDKLIQRFVGYGKILYNNNSNEILLLNWIKHNAINSPKVKACITKELRRVKNREFVKVFQQICIQYQYPIDTVYVEEQEEQETEQVEPEKKNNEIPYKAIIEYLNDKTKKKFRYQAKKTQELIRARWKEDFTLEDFKKVIEIKVEEWANDPKMDKFLRPETLFSTKFEGYLNQKVIKEKVPTYKDFPQTKYSKQFFDSLYVNTKKKE